MRRTTMERLRILLLEDSPLDAELVLTRLMEDGVASEAVRVETRAEELAERDRRKDDFLAMLAHELRNPLGAASNALQLMRHQRTSEPALQRAMSVLERQVQHQVRLVDDLLDVSRITRGKISLER